MPRSLRPARHGTHIFSPSLSCPAHMAGPVSASRTTKGHADNHQPEGGGHPSPSATDHAGGQPAERRGNRRSEYERWDHRRAVLQTALLLTELNGADQRKGYPRRGYGLPLPAARPCTRGFRQRPRDHHDGRRNRRPSTDSHGRRALVRGKAFSGAGQQTRWGQPAAATRAGRSLRRGMALSCWAVLEGWFGGAYLNVKRQR
jgi:hypothetical protein